MPVQLFGLTIGTRIKIAMSVMAASQFQVYRLYEWTVIMMMAVVASIIITI